MVNMRKKFNKKILIIFLVLLISIGFAYLSTTLNLNGTVGFNSNTFDIHFDNIELVSEDVEYTTLEVDSQDNTKVNASINFKEPSEIFEYTVDIVNGGGIDAIFDSITNNISSTIEDYITIDIKYFDGSTINQNDLLRMGQSVKIRVKVIYNYDIDELPSPTSTNITTTVSYKNINVRDITYDRNVWNYKYTGYEQLFIAPKSGTYKIEVWGAQGGSATFNGYNVPGGYGGYSVGKYTLTKEVPIYINVGSQGKNCNKFGYVLATGGYNGGGNSYGGPSDISCAGGGATHVATITGLLSTLGSKKTDVIIVAGAGGGAGIHSSGARNPGGNAGGYIGSRGNSNHQNVNNADGLEDHYGTGGTQETGGKIKNTQYISADFGLGCSYNNKKRNTGGGSGYYGGGCGFSSAASAGGGSGYIGNTNLTDKIMYCYNCQSSENEEDETNIKTRSTTNVSETPTSNYAKIGNGYARITLIN